MYNFKILFLTSYNIDFQGAFAGGFSSLIFTMWFGFGQTFARNYAKSKSALDYSPLLEEWKNTTSNLLKPTSTDQCVDEWWYNKTAGISVFDTKAIEKIEHPEMFEASTATYVSLYTCIIRVFSEDKS